MADATTVQSVEELRALMQQARDLHPGALVFVSVEGEGFTEAFGDDAYDAADLLDLALTSRHFTGDTDRTAMCGFPDYQEAMFGRQLIAEGRPYVVLKCVAG